MKVITALKTPYTKQGKIDFDTFSKLIQRQIDNNIKSFVVAGTTGEGHLMNWEEQILLIKHTVDNFKNVEIIANVGANSTNEACRATEFTFGIGIDKALQINPYYGIPCKDGLYSHLSLLMDFGPTMLYNVPSRTGQDIPFEIASTLSTHDNFKGIKECHSEERVKKYVAQNIPVWSGNDNEAAAASVAGAQGVVSVMSNICPEHTLKLMTDNDEIHNEKYNLLFNWLFKKPNPIGVNTALAMMGLTEPVFRLPYLPFTKIERQIGKEILTEHFNIQNVKVLDDNDFIILPTF